MPNSFANDGAFGATDAWASGGGSSGNPQPTSPNSAESLWANASSMLDHWNGRDPGGTPGTPDPGSYGNGQYSSNDHGWASYNAHELGVKNGAATGTPDPGVYSRGSDGSFKYTPMGFADGGAIPDDETGEGSPEQDRISKALESVDQVLAFGRQLHGLGGGDNEGAIQTAGAMPTIPGNQSNTPGPYKPQQPQPQQVAANMPSVPGSQSNSGAKPVQPMPGPLPPTSNPFGKRADAGSDPDQDGDNDSGQAGAIDTDEDTA